jgi:ATP/ADP translocase
MSEDVGATTVKDKIQVLLHEYAGLRTELIHRQNNAYQLVAVVGALFVWLSSHAIDARFWITLALATPLVCLLGWMLARDTYKAAKRIREIESQVNGFFGEELMVWETRWGGAVTGVFGRARPLL